MLTIGNVLQHRYQLVRVLGSGTLATTFEARDMVTSDSVALKWLRDGNPTLIDIFRNEFEWLRGISHPHLCTLRDFGIEYRSPNYLYFFTTDLIDGIPLSAYAAQKSWSRIKKQICDLLEALEFLHRLGIRHGDVKPSNVLVIESGEAVLIDLSCARPIGHIEPEPNEVSGTLSYMAPEILNGNKADGRADLYAVGVMLQKLFSTLKGRIPNKVRRIADRLQAELAHRPAECREVIELFEGERLPLSIPKGYKNVLVGRDEQIEQFTDHLNRLTTFQKGKRVIYICGREGLGRTRLLQELKWISQQKCEVVEGCVDGIEPVQNILQRALEGKKVSLTLSGVLDVHESLAASESPKILLFDDIQRLPQPQQQLWFCFIRLIDETDPIMVVCTGGSKDIELGVHAEVWKLAPLDREAVAQWVKQTVSLSNLDRLMEYTGGHPAYIDWLIRKISSGFSFKKSISTPLLKDIHIHQSILNELSVSQIEHLSLLAMHEAVLHPPKWPLLGLSSETLISLTALGWSRQQSSGYILQRMSEAPSILKTIPKHILRAQQIKYIKALEDKSRQEATYIPLYVRHLVACGRKKEAKIHFLKAEALYKSEPYRWTKAAEALFSNSRDFNISQRAIEILQEAGEPDRAITYCDRLLSRPLSNFQKAVANQLRGSCYLKLGRNVEASQTLKAALRQLYKCQEQKGSTLQFRVIDQLSRVWIASGKYRQALNLSRHAFIKCHEKEIRTRLMEDIGLAACYIGESSTAQKYLSEALFEHKQNKHTRGLVRVHSYLAIATIREGELQPAIEGYQQALELSQRHGLDDQWASTSLNLGTAFHQKGDYGHALESYKQAMRVVLALGKKSTESILRFNLAQLYADIGLFERCSELVKGYFNEQVLACSKAQLQAEVNHVQGQHPVALEKLQLAENLAQVNSDIRQQVEILLLKAAIQIDLSMLVDANNTLLNCYLLLNHLEAKDLKVRHQWIQGRLFFAQKQQIQALNYYKDALKSAREMRFELHEADILGSLHELFLHQRKGELALQYRDQARIIWQKIAASLSPQLQEVFWLHPRRAWLKRQLDTNATSDAATQLRRFLEINSRINSSLSVSRVLTYAMDAAIEFTKAERGFVLLKKESIKKEALNTHRFRVAIARNIDREQISKSYGKFSRSIAERVMQTEEPVVTVNAQDDDRFAEERSVHAMRLQSVICVPIRTPQGVLGALYLDNRFVRAHFTQTDLEILQAFADQVAIALTNAKLHAELSKRTHDLEMAQRERDRVIDGQAQKIERLQDQVEQRQKVLEYRYDYSQIIGRSPAMRSVLETLERVIDTSISVLIQGESGTGKELIARAIHFNSSRAKQPFVGLNCAALPETLLESQLFGHVRGAFTGAHTDQQGLFISAARGTVFLDELGEASLGVQVKLLRALQEREVLPLGSTKSFPIDIRLVCATSKDLRTEIEQQRFRQDLYYRISVVVINLPRLRDRIEDIPELAYHLLSRASEKTKLTNPRITDSAIRALMQYPWPGNVRELENVLTRALIMRQGSELRVNDLHLSALHSHHATILEKKLPEDRKQFESHEVIRIRSALQAHHWNISKVARMLGIPRQTLYRKLNKYRISRQTLREQGRQAFE